MQVNSICIKKRASYSPNLWVFLDEERISDEISFLKSLPSTRSLGVVVRTRNKKNLYNKAKRIEKICRLKGFKVFVSSSPQIAMSAGADGVHFPQEYKKTRLYNSLAYSCSFHKLSDLRRTIDLKIKKVFISPVFKTASSNSKKPIGLTRLLFLSRSLKCEIGVLGGINNKNINTLRKKNISHIAGVSIFF
tara:strand:+ start:125 stop:697 length:573 start_codon:yes stop_codon:yes gene_type:complete